ncbi:hypothetical protein Gocc_1030 [Gaiella occulta]|uniref:Glycosyl hydrolases family 18 n=1 Tax=Gaiella occulta TaxID=1002870 RepID=A0A7M2Z0L7_9ACTN|nr:hypothetical protein [Gaiella occulta]RDI75232.1 hypothetical protein Gocc_1030 [Gaiella occulta]
MRVAVAAVVAFLVVAAGGAAAGSSAAGSPPFAGLGTWIDVYDGALLVDPVRTADRIAARGVRTVYVETANDRSATDVVNPAGLGLLLDALHARGIQAVAWYLPGFVQPALDLRRTRAMLAFRSPGGAAFDGVALDVESLRLKRVGLRTQRLLALARTLAVEAGDVPVAAIPYPPRAFERHARWWPNFPWAELTPLVDAFIPMTYTGGGFRGYEATYGYVARSLKLLRAAVGPDVPIHAAGGVANRMDADELKAYVDAVGDDGTVSGWSLYDFATTGAKAWSSLAPLGATR